MKYKVEIDYVMRGTTSFEVEAKNADDAAEWANENGEDYAVKSILEDGDDIEIECVDSRPCEKEQSQ